MEMELESRLRFLCESLEPQEADTALDTLIRIVKNVADHPGDEHYRRLHTANKVFSQRVWRHALAREVMVAMGWVEVDGDVVLPVEDHVHSALAELTKCKSLLKPQSSDLKSSEGPVSASKSAKDSTQKLSPYQERMKHLKEIQRKTLEERKRIEEQIRADRQETQTRESRPSHLHHLHSGGHLTRFEDIGVQLNKGGG